MDDVQILEDSRRMEGYGVRGEQEKGKGSAISRSQMSIMAIWPSHPPGVLS